MSLLQWKPEYSVGVADVDLEHKALIEMINDTYGRLEQHGDSADIEECLGELHASIAAHFALEETLMRASAYPEYQAHKEDHEGLLDQVRDFMDGYFEDPDTGRIILQQQLDQWFSVHFSSHDARLHRRLDGR